MTHGDIILNTVYCIVLNTGSRNNDITNCFFVPHQEQHGCDKGGNGDNEEESQQQMDTAMRAKGAGG